MPSALILQHVACEGPGRLNQLLSHRGFNLHICRAFAGDVVPETLQHDLLVVMGGPMGIADIGSTKFPFLEREVALIGSVLSKQQPMLGICLGAQLLAHAAGAAVYPNVVDGQTIREVGWQPVDFHLTTARPELSGLPPAATMLHWHGDTFDLPDQAVLLASTPLCRHQLFSLGRQVGVQFHPEVTADMIAEWVRLDAAYVKLANGAHGVDQVMTDTKNCIEVFRPIADQLLSNLLTQITA